MRIICKDREKIYKILFLEEFNLDQQTTVEAQGVEQEIHHNAPLTSSELAALWRTNSYYSMLRCIYKHFLNTVGDPDLRPLVEHGLSICETRVNQTSTILNIVGQPTSKGITDEDVELGAPRLFTDLYYYYYTLDLIRIGLLINGMNLSNCAREDVRDFYTKSIISTTRYYNLVSKTMLEKGIYIRPPVINSFKESDVVKKQNFLRGFFGERRPMLAEEIERLFFSIRTNVIGGALVTGFQQVARTEQVRSYMAKGAGIARKHVDVLSAIFQKENISVPMHSGELVTDSTIPPFSDKLMMHHVVILVRVGMGNYATSAASSLRHDLSVNYLRLIGEAANYGEDGLNIMIENGWFEEPPRKTDTRDLDREPVH
jgi:hypothetical protein